MKKVILPLLLLLLLPLALTAGTVGKISGRAIDRETREPLLGASILLEGTSLGAATAVKGVYYI
ncbi:hypothetical protein HUU39_21370, partial [candidate division KSB1 bacterium]|nr:hypothetical protein [candidate division KSB1 bacterium]